MKVKLFLVLFGIILHMFYLDLILCRQVQLVSSCPVNEKLNKDNKSPCLIYANSTADRFKGKYFNIVSLIKWKNVYNSPWELQ